MQKTRFGIVRIGINALLMLAVALLVARCSKQKSAAPGTFGNVYGIINTSNCVQCHDGNPGKQNGATLDFTTQDKAYNTLTSASVTATDVQPTCGSLKIVSSGSPSTSYLEAEVDPAFFNDGANFGGISCVPNNHSGTINLSADELSSITQWINAGIPNN